MLPFLLMLIPLAATATQWDSDTDETQGDPDVDNTQWDPVADQLIAFKNSTKGPIGELTTSGGAPVCIEDATSTLNTVLINNEHFLDLMTHLNRERIPERIVHAKGTGAFGYFQVTHDISHICKANFLNKIGKKTPVAVRFSSSAGLRGSSDLVLDNRGFAMKFYTKEGNLDLVGFNTPMYLYKEPLRFHTIIHAGKSNPATNVADFNTVWDLLTLNPEMLHIMTLTFSGRGRPASYRNMPGFPIHTYQVVNKHGDLHFVRWHIMPDCGIKNLGAEEANKINAVDTDHLTTELYQAIGRGEYPSWTVSVQMITKADVKKAGSRIFDATRVISLTEHPLHPVGKIVLNRNAKNFFAEIEQLAFCPANLVPGISGGPDKLFESRRLTYRDAQLYRLGVNFKKIPVNCPFQVKALTYNRDGNGPVGNNEENYPNYYPNSFNGAAPAKKCKSNFLTTIKENKAIDNFDQIAELYSNELTTDERTHLITVIVAQLQRVAGFIQERAIKIFTTIHPDYGYRVAQGLNITSFD